MNGQADVDPRPLDDSEKAVSLCLEGLTSAAYCSLMVGTDPSLAMPRACDADRDRVIAALRDGAARGQLSHQTFVQRVELALHARHGHELADLLADLPHHRPVPRDSVPVRVIGWWSGFTLQVRDAWRAPRMPRLVLPRDGGAVFTIGRGTGNDLCLPDMTVSARHAELRRVGDSWLLADLGSTNGTRVNGWRVSTGSLLRPGDHVEFGRARLRVAD